LLRVGKQRNAMRKYIISYVTKDVVVLNYCLEAENFGSAIEDIKNDMMFVLSVVVLSDEVTDEA